MPHTRGVGGLPTGSDPRTMPTWLRSQLTGDQTRSRWLGLAAAAGFIAVETVGVIFLKRLAPHEAFGTVYLLGVLVVSTVWGPGLATMTSLASALTLGYVRDWPIVRFSLSDVDNVVVVVVYMLVALTTNFVAGLARARRTEDRQLRPVSDRTGQSQQSRILRIGVLLRIGMLLCMVGAMLVGTPRSQWTQQSVLLGLYAGATLWALVVTFSPIGPSVIGSQQRLVFAIADVAVLFSFQLLAPGSYLSLLVLGLAPMIVVPQLGWRRAAVVLSISMVAFVVAVLDDSVIQPQLGWPTTLFLFLVYGYVGGTGLLVAYIEDRHVGDIVGLSALREALLTQTMTASDVSQRRVAEAIHDGALQDLMVARQEMLELAQIAPSVQVERALASLGLGSSRLREAIFELHPVVLEQLGLGAAVEQVAEATAKRAGIVITTDIEYPTRQAIDRIVFGVARELLSNMARHSRATRASVRLAVEAQRCRLDVADNGIGMSTDVAAQRLSEGHIGLASQRARIEAAGGTFTIVDEPVGTHIQIEIPVPASETVAGVDSDLAVRKGP
jgi:two-component system, NarL family, sensor kinase